MRTFDRRSPVSWLTTALIATALGAPAHAQERQWGQDRGIERISESVYRWGSDNQFGAYIARPEGIIVVDGHYCPSGTVDWLAEELERRHDAPVKFVVLSHDHQDHICRTQIFADTAVTVGHRKIRPHIVREQRDSAVPDVTFEREMDLYLGDLAVTLLYFGPSHSDNLIHVHVPEEGVLISIDTARDSLFPDLRDMDVHGALEVYDRLAKLDDVDVVLPGHGPVLTQQNFGRMRDFLEALHDRVLDAMIAGRSLDEIRSSVTMSDFGDLGGLDRALDTNIVTMYDYLYRYREPNRRITESEAVACIEDAGECRTSD